MNRIRTWQRAALAVAVGALWAGASGGPAAADATGGHNAATQTLTCGGEELTIVTPSAPAAAGQVLDANGTLVATHLTITLTFTNPQTGQTVTEVELLTYGPGHGLATGLHDRLVTCDATFTINDPNVGPITVVFVGSFVAAPKR